MTLMLVMRCAVACPSSRAWRTISAASPAPTRRSVAAITVSTERSASSGCARRSAGEKAVKERPPPAGAEAHARLTEVHVRQQALQLVADAARRGRQLVQRGRGVRRRQAARVHQPLHGRRHLPRRARQLLAAQRVVQRGRHHLAGRSRTSSSFFVPTKLYCSFARQIALRRIS